jgi:hypothetical protein
MQHPEQLSIAAIAERALAGLPEGRELLVAGSSTFDRVGVFALGNGPPIVLVDARTPVLPDDDRVSDTQERTDNHLRLFAQGMDQLVEMLSGKATVVRGDWDAMYATDWAFLWTGAGGFRLWTPEGLEVWQESDALHRTGQGPLCELAQVAAIETFVEPGWVERGVRLILRDGRRLTLAMCEEPSVQAFTLYNGLNLTMDAAWAERLGRDLALALGVPHEDGLAAALHPSTAPRPSRPRRVLDLLLALTIHVLALPLWLIQALLWDFPGQTPQEAAATQLAIAIYAGILAIFYLAFLVLLVVWWRQGRKRVYLSPLVAAGLAWCPCLLPLLVAPPVRRALVPPRVASDSRRPAPVS